MASQQQMRRETKTVDKENLEQLPEVTHYESLTVMQGSQPTQQQKTINKNYGATLSQTPATKDTGHAKQNTRSSSATAKDTAMEAGKNTAEYAGKAAGVVKDAAVVAGKTSAEYARKAAGVAKDAAVVAGRGATKFASETATGAAESMEGVNAGVSGIIEGAAAAAEIAAEKAFGFTGTVMEAGKKGAVAGKDVGKTAVGYAGKGVGAVKDVTSVAGRTAVEFASEAQEGVRESIQSLNAGVGTVIEDTAVAAEIAAEKAMGLTDTAVDAGKKGARYTGETIVRNAKDVTFQTGKTAANVVKETTFAGGRLAAELASETAVGARESMEGLNAGVGGVIEGTAVAAEIVGEKVFGAAKTAVDVAKKGAGYIGKTAVAGKDVTFNTGKTAAGYVSKAAEVGKDASLVAGWSAAELASETAAGLTESMEGLNAGVGGVVEGTALATEKLAQKTFETAVDTGKKGASYVGEKVVAGKDVTFETGMATTEYARKAAGVVKDATVAAGRTAVDLASETAAGLTESKENLDAGMAGIIEGAALATEKVGQKTYNTVKEAGRKGASYAGQSVVASKDVALEAGKATGEYVGKAAGAVKDATLLGGRTAVGLASDAAADVTESMEHFNAGVAGLVEGTALASENVAQKTFNTVADVGKKGARYVGETAVAGKDYTMETGKSAGEYVGKAANVAKDASLVAGWGAAKLASGTAEGVNESMENLNAGVAGLVEGTALATEGVAQKTYDTIADVGKKGARVAEKAGKTTMEYAGKATDVSKGATLASGGGAASDIRNVGAGAETKPKKVVVEKEEITIDYGQKRDFTKETKKGLKEQGGYHR